MILFTAPMPSPVNWDRLREDVLAAFANRAEDCNATNYGQTVTVYFQNGKTLAGDDSTFQMIVSHHDPAVLSVKQLADQKQSKREQAARTYLSTLAGKRVQDLTNAEYLKLLAAMAYVLRFIDENGVLLGDVPTNLFSQRG